jgi:RNA polymerase sigma factor (sigma-70 family)
MDGDVCVKVDEGFRVMYEREFPTVYRAVRLLCGDPALAEDATQEAFARALARWRRLGSQPWAAGWVTTTALNVARRQLRRRVTPPAEAPSEPDREGILDLVTAIRRLASRQQEAIVLHYLLDLPVAETAASMGCDAGTVKTHLSRARATLARALGADDDQSDPRSRDHA